MIKCEVIKNFTLGRYKELKNVVKIEARNENEFCKGDTFECDESMADYLTGNNVNKEVVVKVLEVIPEVKEEPKEVEIKEVKKSFKPIKKANKK